MALTLDGWEKRPAYLREWGKACLVLTIAAMLIGCEGGPSESTSGATDSEIVTLHGDPLSRDSSLREILQHPDLLERLQYVGAYLQRTPPEHLDEVQHEFEAAALDQGDFAYAMFANWWARFDPVAAFVYADQTLRFEHPRVVLEVVRIWGYTDPVGALESKLLVSRELHMPALRGELIDALVVGWFQSGRPGLEDYVLSLSDASARNSALRAWVRMRVLRDGAAETLEWTQQAPYHAEIRRQLLAGAVSIVAHQDPELAVEWYDRAKAAGVDVGTFVPRIANAWGHHKPQQALEWVLTFPADIERTRAIAHVARKWLHRDEAGMLAWLEGKAGDETTDTLRFQAIRFHVQQNDYRVDWQDLIDQAQQLVDEKRRISLVSWVLQRWHVADQAGAQAWIDANPDALPPVVMSRVTLIPDEERERIEAALGLQSRG
jgi:hypothetical protein